MSMRRRESRDTCGARKCNEAAAAGTGTNVRPGSCGQQRRRIDGEHSDMCGPGLGLVCPSEWQPRLCHGGFGWFVAPA